MSESSLNPLETILRLCAASAPEPWYPRLYAKQSGVDTHALACCLEELWLHGLIDKKRSDGENGPAISLTREGERVLLEPEAMRRLRAGEPLSSNDRAAIIRQTLTGRLRPHVTVLLVLLNVFVFAAGYWFARQKGLDANFVRGAPFNAALAHILESSGALVPSNLLDGQWWRLLSSGFVHIGIVHLAMNMACLYFAGRFIEQMWGHLRYLAIYLAAIWGGSVLAAAHPVGLFAGASGGVCGVLAAEAVWFLFNRRYLPRSLVRRARTNFILNFVLLVFISSFPGISGWGHFGGAAAGALAALLLHLHRFGPPLWRWLALAGFVPMMWFGQIFLERALALDPKWQEIESQYQQREDRQFVERYVRLLQKNTTKARQVYLEVIEPVLQTHPTRRDEEQVKNALQTLLEQKSQLAKLEDELARAGPYRSPEAEEARTVGRQYLHAVIELFDGSESILRQGDKQTSKDRRALQELKQQVEERRQEWHDLFQ